MSTPVKRPLGPPLFSEFEYQEPPQKKIRHSTLDESGGDFQEDFRDSSAPPLTALPISNSSALAFSTFSSSRDFQETSLNQNLLRDLISNLFNKIEAAILKYPNSSSKDIVHFLICSERALAQQMRQHRLSDLEQKLTPYLGLNPIRKKIETALMQWYLNDPLNSLMKRDLPALNSRIIGMMEEISGDLIQKIIHNSQSLLKVTSPEERDRNYWRTTMSKLARIRSYTSYLHPVEREAFSLLIDHSFYKHSQPLYPNCSRYFKTFCEKLETIVNNELDPVSLMGDLHAKYKEWEAEVKTPPKSEPVMTQEAIFQNRHLQSFWIAGADLLKKAFADELSERVISQIQIPSSLVDAINQTFKAREMGENFNVLLNRVRKGDHLYLEDGVIHDIWVRYLPESREDLDPPSLVSLILQKLPSEEFQNLTRTLGSIDTQIKELAADNLLTGKRRISKYREKAYRIVQFCHLIFSKPLTLTVLKKFCEGNFRR